MKKYQIIDHWYRIEPNQQIIINPVTYKHKGSTYTEDGIRITGTTEFIDSILSRLKDLLSYENPTTRLQLNYQETKDRETAEPTGYYSCYIQVHERGGLIPIK